MLTIDFFSIWNKKNSWKLNIQGHRQRVNDLQFSEEGTLLYSCSDDKLICVWNAISGALE